MIKINPIPAQIEALYYGDEVVRWCNEYELHDVLIQLKKNYEPGYYFHYKGQRIDILPGGKLSCQPEGFFDLIEKQLQEIMGF